MPITARSALAALGLAGLLSACSREVEPFSANERDPSIGTSPGQLTFSPADDRSPAWSMAGDSIYYSTHGGGHLPPDSAVLVGLPVDGGASALILTNAQLEGDIQQSWLVTPTPSPDGGRFAFIDIAFTWSPHPCNPDLAVLQCTPDRPAEAVERPQLGQIAVHVRRPADSGPLSEDDQLLVDVPGVNESFVPGTTVDTVHNYPFQQLFESERAFVMRPSWSPDGERVVFSDGLALRIWTVGQAEAEVIPGTESGVWPSWSPDGDWIAFTRLTAVDSSNVSCQYVGLFVIPCIQERTDFIPGPHLLTLIRPDGSESMELGEGDEPAWTPDGSQLLFRHDSRIWRIDPGGGGPATALPNTENGREPAVSPDGRSLAFARLSARGDWDIWVIPLGN